MAVTTSTNIKIISFSNLKAASSNSLFLVTKGTYLCLLILCSFKKLLFVFQLQNSQEWKKFLPLLQILEEKYSKPFEAFKSSRLKTELKTANPLEDLSSKIRDFYSYTHVRSFLCYNIANTSLNLGQKQPNLSWNYLCVLVSCRFYRDTSDSLVQNQVLDYRQIPQKLFY